VSTPTGPQHEREDVFEDLPEQLDTEDAGRLNYTVTKDAKFRLDRHLTSKLGGMARHQIQKLIELGGVLVNGKPSKASQKLKVGDVVDVAVPPKPVPSLNPEPIPIDVIYEDDGFIVVNKQANLIVHPARSHLSGTLLNALAHHFQQGNAPGTIHRDYTPINTGQLEDAERHITGLSTVGQDDTRPGVIHRLDKHTTGVIVVAKRDSSHWPISKQFEFRENLKAYLAVVHGCPEPLSGAIDQPLGKHPTIREAYAVRHDSLSRESLTLYRVCERYPGYSLVEFELKTGRTHQIRVHAQYIGHPLVGDIVYGGEAITLADLDNPPIPPGSRPLVTYARTREEGIAEWDKAHNREDLLLATPALHAALLAIRHPLTQDPMTFTAPLPPAMQRLISELRKRAKPEDLQVITEGTHVDLEQAILDK